MGGEVGGHFLSASDSKMICVVAVLISVYSICTRISLRFYGSAAGRGSWVRHRATFVGVRLLRGTCLVSGLPRRAVGLRLEDWQIACSRCSPRTCPAAELPRICFWLRPDGGTICRSRAPGAALGPFPAAELPQICFCCALRAQ